MFVAGTFKLADLAVKIFQSLKEDLVKVAQRTWVNFNFDKYALAYADKMREEYGMIQILRMSFPIDLEGYSGIYTRVRVLREQTANQYGEEKEIERNFIERKSFVEFHAKPVDAFETFQKHNKLFILGKPGSGKTTFLKHITMCADKIERLPIFVRLVDFAVSPHFNMGGDNALLNYIAHQFDLCQVPKSIVFIELLLKSGRAVVLFDGLDEVNKELGLRKKVIHYLREFCQQHGCKDDKIGNKIAITCRIAVSDYTFEGFRYVEIADFERAQIEAFVEKWFRMSSDGDTLTKDFMTRFDSEINVVISELARIPLMLALLCMSFPTVKNFKSRSKIIEEAVDVLIKEWDNSRLIIRNKICENLGPAELKAMFAQIAYQSFENGRNVIFKQETLQAEIKWYIASLPTSPTIDSLDLKAILREIEGQTGMFVARSEGIYTYAHLALQEYFTACYWAAKIKAPKTVKRFAKYLGVDGWREVFLLTAELVDEGEGLIMAFIDQLDQYTHLSPRTKEYLTWILSKHSSLNTTSSPFQKSVSIIYISLKTAHWLDLALALDHAMDRAHTVALDRDREIILAFALESAINIHKARDHFLDRALSLVRNLALERGLNYDSDLDHDRDLELACDFTFDFKLDRTLARSLNFANDLNISNSRARGHDFIKQSEQLSMAIGDKEFHQSLRGLEVPNENALFKQRKIYADKLLETIKAHRNLDMYKFTVDEANHLVGYLERVKLIIDCLKVTNMSPEARQRIEARLFTPPQEPA